MFTKLQRECGSFTVIQHPITGNAWPAEVFVREFLLILKEFEDQFDTLFVEGPMEKLLFKDDASRMFFVETAESLNVALMPKKIIDGIDWTSTNGLNFMHYRLQIRFECLKQERERRQKEELERALARERKSKRAEKRAHKGLIW